MISVQCSKCKEIRDMKGKPIHKWSEVIKHLNRNGWFCAGTVAICNFCSEGK